MCPAVYSFKISRYVFFYILNLSCFIKTDSRCLERIVPIYPVGLVLFRSGKTWPYKSPFSYKAYMEVTGTCLQQADNN